MYDWDDLRYVLALARRGTLSHAAADLRSTHTTVGRRVRALESKLEVRLFDQTEAGYVPTAAGQAVAEAAEQMEMRLHTLETQVVGGDTQLQGKLRVTTMDILFRRYAGAFKSFAERHPGIALTITCSDREVSLRRREADVALRLTATPPDYLVGRKVGRVSFAVYASRALVAELGPDATFADYPWLNWDERLDLRWLDGWLAVNAPEARIGARVDVSSLVLREMVASGLGVHFLAPFEGDSDERLTRIGPIDDKFGRDVWLLTLDELRHQARVRAFMDHMSEHICE